MGTLPKFLQPKPAGERASGSNSVIPVRGGSFDLKQPSRAMLLVGFATVLLCLPYLRAVYWTGDEGVLLHGAQRMLHGERIYSDFFSMAPPAGFLLTTFWFELLGASFSSARTLAIATLVIISCVTFLTCWRASKNVPLSALIVCMWVVTTLANPSLIGVTYHWFTTLFCIVAFWAALAGVQRSPDERRWPWISGVAGGTAAMVIPTCGALALLAGMTTFLVGRRSWQRTFTYCVGGLVVPITLIAYLFFDRSLSDAFDQVIRFAFSRYSAIQGVPFGTWGGRNVQRYLFQVAAMAALAVCTLDWGSCRRDRTLHVCMAFALAGFVGCYPRPDIFHILYATPLACPLLAYCGAWFVTRMRLIYRVLALCCLVLISLSMLRTYARLALASLQGSAVQTPRGGAVFLAQPGTTQLLARIAATPASDRYLFYPYMPMMPYLSARQHVAKVDLFVPQITSPSQYQESCLSTVRQAQWVVFDQKWADHRWLQHVFPAMSNPRPIETQRFERALKNGFELVAVEGTFELRRRREGIDDGLCAGIAG